MREVTSHVGGMFTCTPKNCETLLFAPSCLSVRVLLSAWNYLAPTRRSFIKFLLKKKNFEKIQVSIESDKNTGCFTARPVYIYRVFHNVLRDYKHL